MPPGVAPSLLDLIRLSPPGIFPPGGPELYRHIARLTELAAGMELLDLACGRGVSTEFLFRLTRAEAAGVDPDETLIRAAEARAREASLDARLHFQEASLTDLPYKDDIFDVAIAEIGLAACPDPAAAIRELVRVTKPMGALVLVQLIWTGNVDEDRREKLVEHLGARPLLLIEWKQLLRNAGAVELQVEDWSDRASAFASSAGQRVGDFPHAYSFRDRIKVLHRAMQRWGWRGLKGALLREQESHNLLTRERVLGLSLIKAVKWNQAAPAEPSPAPPASA